MFKLMDLHHFVKNHRNIGLLKRIPLKQFNTFSTFSTDYLSEDKLKKILREVESPDGEIDMNPNPEAEEVYPDEYALFGVSPKAVERVKKPPPVFKPKEITKEPVIDITGRAYGTGKRKASVAKVWVKPGNGEFKINRKLLTDYFVTSNYQHEVVKPFLATGTIGDFDVSCSVKGGGHTGQAGAIRLGLSRALENYNPHTRPALKKEGLLTRDARVVERKKPGQKKARKKFQWVKR